MKRGNKADGTRFRFRAISNAGPAKPAFLGVLQNRWLALFRIGNERIAHANFDTCVAPVAHLVIEIDVFKSH